MTAQVKRIYIANDDHTDYFWSGDDVQYRSAFLSMLDYYMTQAETTAYRPSDLRGRFNTDGSLWVWEYERNKSAAAFQRLIGHLRDGNLSMPLNPAVLCYGAMPAEAVLRSMYYAGRLERRHSLRFPLAIAMENQTLPGGIASLWAGSGALYSWKGVCGCASRTDWGNRPREIYHFRGPDGASVCMKWNTMRNGNQSIGGYAEARSPSSAVSYLETNPAFTASWPWPVSAAFGYGWDDMQSTTSSFISTAQSMSTPTRRVIVSNTKDFFEDFLASYGGQIPTFSGSFGNEWDLYTASMGEVTAAFRRGIEKLRTAEAMATVAALYDPTFLASREQARDKAFMASGLYYEHDWTADGPVTRARRAQFQRDMLRDLEAYVNPLHDDARLAIAARVAQPAGVERHMVFNALSWARTDVAELSVGIAAPLRVIDVETGLEVPSQVVATGPTRVRILASAVPSVGYRVYEVRAGAGAAFPPSATVTLPAMQNTNYGVTLGTNGSITSLIDRLDGNRQYVASGGALHSLGSGSGTVTVENAGPVLTTLRVVAGGTPAHETRVTLFAGIDRIEVEGTITQNFSNNVSYASNFNLAGMTMRHEEIGMIARVARAAQGGDYADQNARTDWLSFGHFLDLSLASRGITVSNWDSPFFQAGNSTTSVLDATTPSFRACVGMQVDGTGLGIQNQGGDSRFLNRFAFTVHGAYDPAAAMRFALAHQNPLVAARVTGTPVSPLPQTSWSLVSLPSPDVLLWSLKPSEEGITAGVIARVWNLAEGVRTMSLSLPGAPLIAAVKTTHVETDTGPAAVVGEVLTETLARQQMATFRLAPRSHVGVNDTFPPAAVRDLN